MANLFFTRAVILCERLFEIGMSLGCALLMAGEPLTPSEDGENGYGVGKYWGFLVGVNRYQHLGQNTIRKDLEGAVKDAQDFYHFLLENSSSPDRIVLLTDDHADAAFVQMELKRFLARIPNQRDQLVFFLFSGHGERRGTENFLWACDTDPQYLEETALRTNAIYEEIATSLPEVRKVVVIDACDVGPAVDERDDTAFPLASSGNMVYFFAGGQGQQVREAPGGEGGYLTQSLLKALRGRTRCLEKTSSNAYGRFISPLEAWDYANTVMPILTKDRQKPKLWPPGPSAFPLAETGSPCMLPTRLAHQPPSAIGGRAKKEIKICFSPFEYFREFDAWLHIETEKQGRRVIAMAPWARDRKKGSGSTCSNDDPRHQVFYALINPKPFTRAP